MYAIVDTAHGNRILFRKKTLANIAKEIARMERRFYLRDEKLPALGIVGSRSTFDLRTLTDEERREYVSAIVAARESLK